jgi:hypothetical protein
MSISCKKIIGNTTIRRLNGPASSPFRPLGRILERWRECWRLAAFPDVDTTATAGKFKHSIPTLHPETQPGEYTPKAGMRGKNVRWVPSSPVVMDKMLDMANVTSGDYVIDPGSGDGRVVIQAAKRGARALGIESNPKLVTLSRENAEKEKVGDKANFTLGDFFKTDFSEATVITLFLRKDLNIALRPRILDLKPGTRVVSNIFDMGGWEADDVVKVEDGDYYFKNHTAHLWIVPSKVEGAWKLPLGELALSQKYQMITGTLKTGNDTLPVDGKMTGNRIDLTTDDGQYTGLVNGARMVLEAIGGSKIRRIRRVKNSRGRGKNKKQG